MGHIQLELNTEHAAYNKPVETFSTPQAGFFMPG